LNAANIPIQALPKDYGWMLIGGHAKIAKLVEPALNTLKDEEALVLAASGASITKVISLAEILVREHKDDLHLILKRGHRKIEDFWDPLIEHIDPLVVTRQIETIHILISVNEIDTSESDEVDLKAKRPRTRKPNNRTQGGNQNRSEQKRGGTRKNTGDQENARNAAGNAQGGRGGNNNPRGNTSRGGARGGGGGKKKSNRDWEGKTAAEELGLVRHKK